MAILFLHRQYICWWKVALMSWPGSMWRCWRLLCTIILMDPIIFTLWSLQTPNLCGKLYWPPGNCSKVELLKWLNHHLSKYGRSCNMCRYSSLSTIRLTILQTDRMPYTGVEFLRELNLVWNDQVKLKMTLICSKRHLSTKILLHNFLNIAILAHFQPFLARSYY